MLDKIINSEPDDYKTKTNNKGVSLDDIMRGKPGVMLHCPPTHVGRIEEYIKRKYGLKAEDSGESFLFLQPEDPHGFLNWLQGDLVYKYLGRIYLWGRVTEDKKELEKIDFSGDVVRVQAYPKSL